MALITLQLNPEAAKSTDQKSKHKHKPKPKPKPTHHQQPSKRTVVSKQEKKRHQNISPATKPKNPKPTQSSWDQIKSLLTCKQIEPTQVHEPSSKSTGSKLGSSCGSICSFRDVVHGNTRVVHRADNSPESSSLGHDTAGLLSRHKAVTRSSRSNGGGACTSSSTSSYSRGMQFRKLSGCYECHMIVDPSRYPIQPRSTICACPQCGEVFPKIESLELHQAVRHAVSELGAEDSGRNIVEIIFKSSWVKKEIHSPAVKIDRILKVHNTHRTIQRFEDCRDSVKSVARKNPRCSADGNELLRFHCASLSCSLGSRGSSSLCSITACHVCSTIRHGFSAVTGDGGIGGVLTTASSGRAHDALSPSSSSSRRAMIVCRVIAGRVKRDSGDSGDVSESGVAGGYDSVAGASSGIYNNLEELVVFNPRAILPCFVVIYKTLGSDLI